MHISVYMYVCVCILAPTWRMYMYMYVYIYIYTFMLFTHLYILPVFIHVSITFLYTSMLIRLFAHISICLLSRHCLLAHLHGVSIEAFAPKKARKGLGLRDLGLRAFIFKARTRRRELLLRHTAQLHIPASARAMQSELQSFVDLWRCLGRSRVTWCDGLSRS